MNSDLAVFNLHCLKPVPMEMCSRQWEIQTAHFIILCRYCKKKKQIEGLWQRCFEQVHQHHFSNSICSHPVSYILVIFTIFQILNPPPAQRLQLTEGADDGQQFLAIKYFLIEVCPFFKT